MLKNIVANFLGRFWSILANFLFVPLYIQILGFDNFSIISFTLVIAGIMVILDSGLTATLSREFARLDVLRSYKNKLFNSFESIYAFIILVVIGFLFLTSNLISIYFLSNNQEEDITFFIKIISIDVGFQMLLRFYMGGLIGLNHQVVANVYQILWGVFRNAGVLVIIYYIPSLMMFFIWQAACTVIFAFLFRYVLTQRIGGEKFFRITLKIDFLILKKVWKFAFGMILISIVAVVSTQLDKLFVSKLLPLTELGYYTIAISLATGIVVLINPIQSATLPSFTGIFSEGQISKAIELFNKILRYYSVIIASLVSLLVVFSNEIIWVWTGDTSIAINTAPLVSIMSLAYAMLAFATLPYNVAIANGYTKLNNYLGIIGSIITIPGYYIATNFYGSLGTAFVYVIMQCVITLMYYYFINSKFLQIRNFIFQFFKMILIPLFCAIIISYGAKYLIEFLGFESRLLMLLYLICICTLVTLINSFLFLSVSDKRQIISLLKLLFFKSNSYVR